MFLKFQFMVTPYGLGPRGLLKYFKTQFFISIFNSHKGDPHKKIIFNISAILTKIELALMTFQIEQTRLVDQKSTDVLVFQEPLSRKNFENLDTTQNLSGKMVNQSLASPLGLREYIAEQVKNIFVGIQESFVGIPP